MQVLNGRGVKPSPPPRAGSCSGYVARESESTALTGADMEERVLSLEEKQGELLDTVKALRYELEQHLPAQSALESRTYNACIDLGFSTCAIPINVFSVRFLVFSDF